MSSSLIVEIEPYDLSLVVDAVNFRKRGVEDIDDCEIGLANEETMANQTAESDKIVSDDLTLVIDSKVCRA